MKKIIHGIARYDAQSGELVEWEALALGSDGLPVAIAHEKLLKLIDHFELDPVTDPKMTMAIPLLPEDFLVLADLFSNIIQPDFSHSAYQIEAAYDDLTLY
jgi:hypothetical protein